MSNLMIELNAALEKVQKSIDEGKARELELNADIEAAESRLKEKREEIAQIKAKRAEHETSMSAFQAIGKAAGEEIGGLKSGLYELIATATTDSIAVSDLQDFYAESFGENFVREDVQDRAA